MKTPSNVNPNTGRIKKGWSRDNYKKTAWETMNEMVVKAGEALWVDSDGTITRVEDVKKEKTNE